MGWVVNGQPTTPFTSTNLSFSSKELCEAASTAVLADISESPTGEAKLYVHAVCAQRK